MCSRRKPRCNIARGVVTSSVVSALRQTCCLCRLSLIQGSLRAKN
jgi:hypothetical protein